LTALIRPDRQPGRGYVPTIVEWMIVAGVLAFGGLLFTAAVLFLPMQEPEAH